MGDYIKTAEGIFVSCIMCQQHNSGKLKVWHDQESNPKGLFEQREMDFIQFPLSMRFEYVLVIVCLFSDISWIFIL